MGGYGQGGYGQGGYGIGAIPALTDVYLTEQASYLLLENAGGDATTTFATSMFSFTQFINALNDRQHRFLKDTGIVTRHGKDGNGAPLGGQAQISRYTLPSDWIETRRLSWTDAITNQTVGLTRLDAYQLDAGLGTWEQQSGLPQFYHESTLPTRTTEIVPKPANAGQLNIIYTALAKALDGSGIVLTIPDMFVPSVMWGAIGDLLAQDGEGHEAARAGYCQMRYDMGVELARLLLRGPLA